VCVWLSVTSGYHLDGIAVNQRRKLSNRKPSTDQPPRLPGYDRRFASYEVPAICLLRWRT
jgi:hypothetical protein